MKNTCLFLILVVFSSSCASVLTGRYSRVEINTTRNVPLVIDGDTISRKDNQPIPAYVKNERGSLPIVVLDSTRTRLIAVRSKKPVSYWANVFTPYVFSGFLVDEITGLKWHYPKKILIDVDGVGNSYLPYVPMADSVLARKNMITFAPIQLINAYHPAVEFGYERLQGRDWATHMSLGIWRSWDNNYSRNSSGFKATLEQKRFLRNASSTRFYLSMALEYIHKDHDANLWLTPIDALGNVVLPQINFLQSTRVEKRFISLTPRIGVQTYLTSRLVGEAFVGVGLRSRKVRHANVSPFARYEEDFDTLFFDTEYLSNRPINDFTLNLDFNFRVGYVF